VVLAVKHNAGHGVVFGMAECNKGGGYTTICGEFLRWPGKYEKQFVARIFADADVAPTHRFADGIGGHSNIFRTIAINPQGSNRGVLN
jgi:hypothetical protein